MLISFTTKRTKNTKGSEIDIFEFLNFVLFVTFVVQCLFRFLGYGFAALRTAHENANLPCLTRAKRFI